MYRADPGDVRETLSRFRHGMKGDVTAMTHQHRRESLGSGVDGRGSGRIHARRVGGGEQDGGQTSGVQACGRDSAQIGEGVLERHPPQGSESVTSGATKVPRIGRMPLGSKYSSVRWPRKRNRPLTARPLLIGTTWVIEIVPFGRDNACSNSAVKCLLQLPQLLIGRQKGS